MLNELYNNPGVTGYLTIYSPIHTHAILTIAIAGLLNLWSFKECPEAPGTDDSVDVEDEDVGHQVQREGHLTEDGQGSEGDIGGQGFARQLGVQTVGLWIDENIVTTAVLIIILC